MILEVEAHRLLEAARFVVLVEGLETGIDQPAGASFRKLASLIIPARLVQRDDALFAVIEGLRIDTPVLIVLVGPTASFIPDILFDYGVNIIGGLKIFDSKAVLRVIQEGGGTKLFIKYGKKYNLEREK